MRSAGARPTQLALVGGGARSEMWAQLLASCLDLRITLHEESSAGAALGAARLAWLADGGDLAAVCPPPPLRRMFEPQAAERDLLQQRLQRYRALYPALRDALAAPSHPSR